MSSSPSDLANRRAEIDQYDREIHTLLQKRAKVVFGVMRAKAAATAAGEPTPPFRPGREAEVLRKLVAQHDGDFPIPSLLRIWREIISGATRMQAVQQIAVLAEDQNSWDLARDHFGISGEDVRTECLNTLLDDAANNRVAAAVVPACPSQEAAFWWRSYLSEADNQGAPHIVARLPFFGEKAAQGAFVLSAFPSDPSSDDVSVIALSGAPDAGTSVSALIESAGLTLPSAPASTDGAMLVEISGDPDKQAAMPAALAELPGVTKVRPLGSYAQPLSV